MSESSYGATVQSAASGDAMAGLTATPGSLLASARREHGLTVEQVASQLNLAPRQVMALEEDRYAALPGMVIVRGFVRSYAKLLKIDPLPLVAMLADATPSVGTPPARQMASSSFTQSRMPPMHAGAGRSIKAPLAGLLAVIAVAAGASYMLGWWPDSLTRRFGQLRGAVVDGSGSAIAPAVDANDAVRAADAGSTTGSAAGVAQDAAGKSTPGDPVAGQPPALTSTTVLSSPGVGRSAGSAGSAGSAILAINPSGPGSTDNTAAGMAVANPLVLHVQQDSWIEIKRANNTAIVSRLVKAGSVETFAIDQPVTLIIGNLAGVDATLRGAPLALDNGAKGNVAKLRIE